jgi:hypothetical protein
MRHIEIAENIARAARQAEERGEHGLAATLFFKALRVLQGKAVDQSRNVSSLYAQARRWAATRNGQVLSETVVAPPPSTVRRWRRS